MRCSPVSFDGIFVSSDWPLIPGIIAWLVASKFLYAIKSFLLIYFSAYDMLPYAIIASL
jgi:hypothetical protein